MVEIWNGEVVYGVVNFCVEIVGKNKWIELMKGLVNVVLCKVGNECFGVWDWLLELCLFNWFCCLLIDVWGKEVIVGIECVYVVGVLLDIIVKGDVVVLVEILGGIVLLIGFIWLYDVG